MVNSQPNYCNVTTAGNDNSAGLLAPITNGNAIVSQPQPVQQNQQTTTAGFGEFYSNKMYIQISFSFLKFISQQLRYLMVRQL